MNRISAVRAFIVAAVTLVACPAYSQDLRDVAVTTNQFRTADALERFYATATDCDCDLAQSVRYLRAVPAADARYGLDVLSGRDLAGMLGPRQALSGHFIQRMTWQLRPAGPEPPRRLIEYVDSPTGGTNPVGVTACDPGCGRRAYLAPPAPAVWFQGFGAGLEQSGGIGSYDSGMGGVLFGGHAPVTDELAFGLAGNYGHVTGDAMRASLDVDAWRFLGYGRYVGETAYAFGGLGYGFDDYETDRRIAFGPFDRTASGETSGNEAFAFAETGLTLPVSGTLAFQPFVGLTGSHLTRDGFTETSDSVLNLRVAGADASSFASYFGGRAVVQQYLAPDLLLRPELRAAWWHDFLDDAGTTTVAFTRDVTVPFAVAAAAPGRDAAVLGTGVTLIAAERCSIGAQYDAAVASEAILHAVAVTALCTW